MKLYINIIHQDKNLNLKINAPIKIAVETFINYIEKTFYTKLSKTEKDILQKLIINNNTITNNINQLADELQTSKRTAYRARKKLNKLNIIQYNKLHITPNNNTFQSFISYIM